jgi:Trm5-related predicted tRNA methylase
MVLNRFGQIAHDEWIQTPVIRGNCHLHEFIIMPNHIHGIIEILFQVGDPEKHREAIGKFQSPSQTIGSIIRGFKIATIKKIMEEILNSESNRGDLPRGELPRGKK